MNQQIAEFIGQLGFLGRSSLTPVPACSQSGHTLKIDVRENFLLNKSVNLFLIAFFEFFIGFCRIDDFLADTFDQCIRSFHRMGGCGKAQYANSHQEDKPVFQDFHFGL